MPRISRKDLGTPFLHVMVQGINKEYIFYKEEYIEAYLNFINKYKEEYNFTLIAYCIMTNHAHFLVYTEDIKDFGRFMHKINCMFAQMFNELENRCGVIFRNRYKAEPIYNTKYLINCIKYIHENPVNANMVERPEEYKYSSYMDFINNMGSTNSKIMIEIFGENCDYTELFNKTVKKNFIDIEKLDDEKLWEYMNNGINEFINEIKISLESIFSDRCALKSLIFYLHDNWNFKYTQIGEKLQIPRGIMNRLIKKK